MVIKSFLTACLVLGFGLASAIPHDRQHNAKKTSLNGTTKKSACTNSPDSRGCWNRQFSIDTDAEETWPTTGRTVKYSLEITNKTMYPDGVARDMLVINGQYPGPTITADWGDFVEIDVTNSMEHNGTSMHWHGIIQQNSCTQDGVNGVTECPIPPGATRKYRFQATEYGTSWYHSHFTYQYGDGIVGTMIINGPATADYDVDLGVLPITDHYYQSTWIAGHAAEKSGPPAGNNILVNGTNVNLQGTGGHFYNTTMIPGKRYLLRLVNTAVDNAFMVSIDNHRFNVIQADFVPIDPYKADWVYLAIGQRLNVIIEPTSHALGNHWFRAEIPKGCGSNYNNHSTMGIFNYATVPLTLPTSLPTPYKSRCYDETSLVPYIPKPVPRADFEATYGVKNTLTINLTTTEHKIFRWTINGETMNVDWENPTLKYISESNDTYRSIRELNLYELPTANVWSFWVIQNSFPVAHPIHLHGHDFYRLGSSPNIVPTPKTPIFFGEDDIEGLEWEAPTRRDVAMLPGNGWLVLAFKTDNPGAWLMHCHIAWHVSEGLGVQFLERASEIDGMMGEGLGAMKEGCREWSSWYNGRSPTKDDSGL